LWFFFFRSLAGNFLLPLKGVFFFTAEMIPP
jgi:hypothetical protein